MKTTTLLCFILTSAFAFGADATPTPVPTPTPTPVATIRLSDGHDYTAAQIEQGTRELQTRVNELLQQRNAYLGQIVDLDSQLKKLQASASAAPAVAPAPTPSPTPEPKAEKK